LRQCSISSWIAIHAERRGFDVVGPWRRTEDPDTLRAVMTEAGVLASEIPTEVDVLPVESDD
jgi:hypothetical protein